MCRLFGGFHMNFLSKLFNVPKVSCYILSPSHLFKIKMYLSWAKLEIRFGKDLHNHLNRC